MSALQYNQINVTRSKSNLSNYSRLFPAEPGRHAIITTTADSGEGQLLLKRAGVGRGLSIKEARILAAEVEVYRSELRASGWCIPRMTETEISIIDGSAEIWSLEEYVHGLDIRCAVRSKQLSSAQCLDLLDWCVDRLADYGTLPKLYSSVSRHSLSILPHGIDFKPSNIVVNSSFKPYLVDVFPPLLRSTDNRWNHIPTALQTFETDKLDFVCGSREGALLRFYRLLEWECAREGVNTRKFRSTFLSRIRESAAIDDRECKYLATELDKGFPSLEQYYSRSSILRSRHE